NDARCLTFQSEQTGIAERFQTYSTQVFEEIQSILKENPLGNVLIQIVVPTHEEKQLFSGLSGMLKTVQQENPKLIGQLIEVETREDSEGIITKLKENSRSPIDSVVRYEDGKRYVSHWSEVKTFQEDVALPWKDYGVYLITGGIGGLGLLFAKEIVQRTKNVTLILTGRSSLSEDKKTELNQLRSLGGTIVYRQTDVIDKEEVVQLIQSIQQEFGSLHGIIHGAGIIRDNFILKKTKEELQDVLAPKVLGLVNLDEASKDLQLDFFVLFSSIAGSLGNSGQADYSTANAFMDVYAKYRNALVAAKKRQGQTLSLNWPLWKEGGMQVDKETEKMMMRSMGMDTMQTSTGIEVFYQGFSSRNSQVMVMEGDTIRIKDKLIMKAQPSIPMEYVKASGSIKESDVNTLLDKVQAALTQTVSKLLKVRVEDIDVDAELNEYGFDSILFTQLTNLLSEEYKIELIPTVFFEYPTIQSFSKHMIEEYQAAFASRFSVKVEMVETSNQVMKNEIVGTIISKERKSRFVKTAGLLESYTEQVVSEPIAIVGMSGLFPMAKNINELWRNLVDEKDCITEIPKERWDWREYYGNPK
ncbi:hypothetical protein IEE_05054, partial [Bacillus cereus BAG5X1-1]